MKKIPETGTIFEGLAAVNAQAITPVFILILDQPGWQKQLQSIKTSLGRSA